MRRAIGALGFCLLLAGCSSTPPASVRAEKGDSQTYRLEAIPKSDATRIDDRHVRSMIGAVLDLDHEDGRNYYVRLYNAPKGEAPPPAPAASPTPVPPPPPAVALSAGEIGLTDFGKGLPASGQWREGFGVGDVNGDGHPDLVFPPARKSFGLPAIFLGDGQGNWKRWREARFPRLPYDYGDAQVADFNGDGFGDIALAMHRKGIVVLLGDGKGGFRSASEGLDFVPESGGLPAFSARCLRVVDWNADGRPDIVALGEGPALPTGGAVAFPSMGIVLYENLGDGKWRRRTEKSRTTPPLGSSMAVGDFDGDGRLDLAFATAVLGSRELLAFGNAEGGWTYGSVDTLPADGYLKTIAAADFDGDGVDDIVVGGDYQRGEDWAPRLDVFLSRNHGRSWEIRGLTNEDQIAAVAAGPLRGEGAPSDVVALTNVGKLLFFFGDGHGGFSRVNTAQPPAGCAPSSVQLVDLDGDGRREIVAAFGDEGEDEGNPCPSQGKVVAWKVILPGHSD